MKTILYALLAIFILGIFTPAIMQQVNAQTTVISLRATEQQVSLASLNQSVEIIKNRLTAYGISGAGISINSLKNGIEVKIPSKADEPAVRRLLVQKGEIRFIPGYNPNNQSVVKNTYYQVTGTDIEMVQATAEQSTSNYGIDIRFNPSAVEKWAQMTRENINQNIAIMLDDSVIFAPVLKSEITTGVCSITGKFTRSEAGFIAAVANHGILPVDFVILK